MAAPPPPPGPSRHRRYWTYVDRPYAGFGCLWVIVMFLIFYWIMAWFFVPLRFGYW